MNCSCCQKHEDARNINRILTEEREQSEKNFQRMENALNYKRKLETADGTLLLTVDSLITLNNIVLNKNNLGLRKHDVKPAGYDRKYMSFYDVLTALTGLVDTYNNGKITPKTFVETFLKIHPFADGNGRTCKILFMYYIYYLQKNK